jgi:methyl-accepting chemotaxis protein
MAAAMQRLVGNLNLAATTLETTATSMSATAEQTSANVATVAAATEQLATSVREIGLQMTQSSKIASRAAEDAQITDSTVQTLAANAQKIGEVVMLIQTIAS